MSIELPIITNIRADTPCADFSAVTVEGNSPFRYRLSMCSPLVSIISLAGVRTRIPPSMIRVYDGLLDTLRLAPRETGLEILLRIEHPTEMALRESPGLPARLRLELSREPLRRIFRGRKVVLDPGHGGHDTGGRGPIDLQEKDMTMAVAVNIQKQLLELGCLAVLTRNGDEALSWGERLDIAARAGTDAMVSLHTGWFKDPDAGGFRLDWLNAQGYEMAGCIHYALLRKLSIPDRGIGRGLVQAGLRQPAVSIEFATISNPVEEGWLRSSTFLSRAARAVTNGLKDYFTVH